MLRFRVRIATHLIAILLLGSSTSVQARTRTPIPTFTPQSLPDLVVESARIRIPGFTGRCLNGGPSNLSLEICIANRGTTAGPFNLTVNGAHFARVDGIDTSDRECVFGPHTYPNETTIFLDDEDEIEEGDETNNETTRFVPIPTRPPDCTPTPTPMPIVTPAPVCVGDCNGDGVVAINELVLMVNIVLDRAPLDACPHFEDWQCFICINMMVEAVNALLRGCP